MKSSVKKILSLILVITVIATVVSPSLFLNYADASSSSYSSWGSWSAWQDTAVTETEFVDVETQQVATAYKTVYHYFRYSTKRVADGKGGSDIPTSTYGSNYYTYDFDYKLTIKGSNGNYSQGYKYYYNAANGNTVSGNWITVWKCDPFTTQEPTAYKTQYRYRTRTRTDTYVVSYNANGGTGAPSSQNKTNVVSKNGTTYNPLTLSSTIPTKKYTITFNANGGSVSSSTKTYSCTFNNWNTKSDGTGTSYAKGGTYNTSADTTLYAQWKNTTYGTLPTPTKSNARFDGWYTAATGGTKVTSSGTVTGNKTLYAHWTDIYTVNFNANGGTGAPSSITFYDGDSVTLPTATPTKKYTVTYNANGGSCATTTQSVSCTFTKWNSLANGTGASYNAGGLYIADSTATIYAQWTNNKIGTLPTPTRTGYVFNGWYTATTGGTKISTDTIVSSNVTYYAQWTKNNYSVVFNSNGATSGTMSNLSMTYDDAKNLTANAYAKTGYTFTGWNTKADGSGTTYTDKASVKNLTSTKGGTVTLYAQWATNSYSIVFNGNGATSGTMSNLAMTYDVAKNLTANAYAKTGYTFTGWNTKADGSGTTYADKVSVKNLTSTKSGTVTLYAQWSAKSFTVTFDANGGTCSTASKSVTYDSTYGTLPTPTRIGYVFNGWYTAATNGSKITADSKVSITAAQTLYAQWTKNSYSIVFNGNGATSGTMSNLAMTYDVAKNLTANAYAKTGYTFTGWNTKADESGTTYADKASVKNLTSTKGGTVTLYAQWSAKSFTVTFDANGGTCSTASKSVTYDSTYGTLPTPTRTGYVFNGWYTAATNGSKITADSKVSITAAQTLYAQWTKNSYSIVFNGNGATSGTMSNLAMTYDVAKNLTANAYSKTGYTFTGWNTKADGSGTIYADKVSVKNLTSTKGGTVTLYAQWVLICSITYDADGGTGAPASQTVLAGNGITLSSTKPNKSYKLSFVVNASDATVSDTGKTISATFVNWKDSNSNTYTPGKSYVFTNHTKLVAQWKNPTAGTLPIPTRDGYYFSGWYTKSEGGTQYTSSTTVSGNTTLYAHWTLIPTYAVSYDTNGGESGPTAQTKVENVELVLSDIIPKKSFAVTYNANGGNCAEKGSTATYEFNSWNTSSDGKGKTYYPGDVYAENAELTLIAVWDYLGVETIPVPTRNGYTFNGWFTEVSGGEKISTSSVVSTDITLYAQWTKNSYSIVFNGNGSTSGTMSNLAMTYDVAKNLTANAYSKTGYTFTCWNTKADGSGTIYADKVSVKNLTSTKGGTVTLYAQWSAKSFTVTFDANGGTCSTASKSVTYDSTYGTLPTPTRTGYVFNGWFTAATNGSKITADSKVSITAAQTLYAQWTKNSYSIVFNGNGSTSGTMSNLAMTYDVAKNLTANAYSKTGYTFTGWNTKADGSGTTYADKVSVKNLTSTKGGTVTLYAQWTFGSYTVYFDANDGVCSTASKAVRYDNSYGELPIATRIGYTFNGWYTEASGGQKVVAEDIVKKDTNHTIYAQWLLNCKVTFDTVGGTGAPESFVSVEGCSSKLSDVTPQKTFTITYNDNSGTVTDTKKSVVCEFVGWKDGENTYASGSDAVFYDHTTLYAQWKNPNAGTLPVPTKQGYHFVGWFDRSVGGKKYTSDSEITKNITLHAQWEANTYTVLFVSGNESLAEVVMTYDKSAKISYGAIPDKEGYSFISWSINGKTYSEGAQVKNLTIKNGDVIECKAVWNRNLTLDDLTYSFGNSDRDYGYSKNYVIPLSSYRLVFGKTTLGDSYYYNSRNKIWGGNCYGMSSSSVMFNNNGTSETYITDYNSDATMVSDLSVGDRYNEITLTQYIEAMQVSQKCMVIQDSYKVHKNDLNNMVAHINKQVKTNELPIIGIFGPEGGHAIVAIGIEMVSDYEGKLYVYDCNFPGEIRYISLKFDGKGNCVSWYYCMNDKHDWGTDYDDCWITYVPYSDFEFVWENRGNQDVLSKKNSNLIYTKSENCWVKDENGTVLCMIKDGEFTAYQDYVCELILAEMNDESDEFLKYIYLPVDKYTIENLDESESSFETGIVNIELGATVTTSADNVTYGASDEKDSIFISIDSSEGDTYELTMQSSFEEGFDTVTLSGTADGSKIILSEENGEYDYQVNNSTGVTLTVDGENQTIDKKNMIQSIEIVTYPKTSYYYKIHKTIDTTGLQLCVYYTDGTSEIISDTSEITCEGLEPQNTGTQTITVHYGNASTSYSINVQYAWWQWIIRILFLGFLWY